MENEWVPASVNSCQQIDTSVEMSELIQCGMAHNDKRETLFYKQIFFVINQKVFFLMYNIEGNFVCHFSGV